MIDAAGSWQAKQRASAPPAHLALRVMRSCGGRRGGSVYSTFPAITQLDSAGAGLSWTPYTALTFEGSVGVPWRTVIADQSRYELYGRIIFRPLELL